MQKLTAPLDYLLALGGDSRLWVDPIHMLNDYGCRPWPRPEAFTFASSTATSISERGYRAAAGARQQLIESIRNERLEDAGDRLAELLRKQLKAFLELGAFSPEIVFSPSGTDSQVHALYIAQTVLDGPLVTVIVGSDETGSGTAHAMIGCHFNSGTAQGNTVSKGKSIAGFAEDTVKIEIPFRDENARLRSHKAINQEVLVALAQAVDSGKRVVLHVMDTSKLGSRCPSLDCLREVQSNWGRSVQVVVDACQLRLSRQRLQYYLSQNFMVIITGSKFLTGPPLSGALLVPAATSKLMKQIATAPGGLELYTDRTDWPTHWNGVRSMLPVRPNWGQLLRWVAAIEELKAFFTVPASYRSLALQEFSRVVPCLIAERSNLTPVPWFRSAGEDGIDDEEMSARTIFPFFIADRGKLLSVEACSRIYRALNLDVSNLLPRSAPAAKRKVAASLCHIGQPVAMPHPSNGLAGTLRISAGARVVSDTWRPAGLTASLQILAHEFAQVRTILDKIDLLVEMIDTLGDTDEARFGISIAEAESSPLVSRHMTADGIRKSRVRPATQFVDTARISGAEHG